MRNIQDYVAEEHLPDAALPGPFEVISAPCSPISSSASEIGAPCSPISSTVSQPLLETNSLSFLWLELTERCNLRCAHCYADASPERSLTGRMRFEDWRLVLDRAAGSGCRQVQFIGGEPTLHPHFAELLQYAASLGYLMIEVFSNGTRLNSFVLEAIRTAGARLAVSMYGPNESVHDAITLTPGSFRHTLNGIAEALRIGLPVRVGVITNNLSSDEVDATVRVLREAGVSQVTIHRTQAVGRAANNFHDITQSVGCGRCGRGTLCVTAMGTVQSCVFARSRPLGSIWNWAWPVLVNASA